MLYGKALEMWTMVAADPNRGVQADMSLTIGVAWRMVWGWTLRV